MVKRAKPKSLHELYTELDREEKARLKAFNDKMEAFFAELMELRRKLERSE